MSIRKTIGGDRLGAGKKMTVDLKSYERSTHDLGYVWRSTMAAGTLVPFMHEVGLPGDTFDINLECDIKTHPTIGPLFGSYKVQLDVFQCPIRLYQGQLHNNKLGIGREMANVKLPQIRMRGRTPRIVGSQLEGESEYQINPSSIFSYLGINGLGHGVGATAAPEVIEREFNATPYIAYWDIYKNYYANKQEEIGAVIHTDDSLTDNNFGVQMLELTANGQHFSWGNENTIENFLPIIQQILTETGTVEITGLRIFTPQTSEENNLLEKLFITAMENESQSVGIMSLNQLASINGASFSYDISENPQLWEYKLQGTIQIFNTRGIRLSSIDEFDPLGTEPKLTTFPLSNIDDMREDILTATKNTNAYIIDHDTYAPYGLSLTNDTQRHFYSKMYSQEGLAIKTYQSDLFNNWMSTEWIDGENGISAVTAIDTSDGNFTIDTLNLSKKVYDMLNRIAISGGSYDDWLDVVYTHDRVKRAESPIYQGGLIRELVFSEVVSTADADFSGGGESQPLGTLAGKGVMGNKKKGGRVRVKVDEPSYLIGIISLTPRVDYSQGNKWDVNLKTMDDFHKPALDQIGFQDLVTDQMAAWETKYEHEATGDRMTFKSAGKQPAWINYMTNVNQARGNFAIEGNEMFMTLNRRYEIGRLDDDSELNYGIKDLTTYIDPVKFNHIFAYTKRDAQNFWAQIGVDITARRKMSAKIMPNL